MMTTSSSIQSIATAVTVQFGPHFAKNIAPLKLYFSSDPQWSINAADWGLFQTAVTVPCAIFPWLIGHSVDKNVHPKTILVAALVFSCIGQLIFIIAVRDRLYDFSLLGRFVFGMGEGLTSSLTGYIAVRFAPRHKLFAIGMSQSFHALSVALSKATMAPIANYWASYVASLIVALLLCAISLTAACVWSPKEYRPTRPEDTCNSPATISRKICCQGPPGKLTVDFWIVAIMHLLFSSAHRLFGHVDAPFLGDKFGHSLSGAGYASSVTEFVAVMIAPFLGAMLDRYCTVHTLPVMLVGAAAVGAIGYAIIGYESVGMAGLEVGLVMIGIVNGITPTVMRSVIPETVHDSVTATAFGVYESSESIGIAVGSVIVGMVAQRAHDDYSACIPVFSGLLVLAGALACGLVVKRNRIIRTFHKRTDNIPHAMPYYTE